MEAASALSTKGGKQPPLGDTRTPAADSGTVRDTAAAAAKPNDESKQEQQMIDTAQDVTYPELDKAGGGFIPGWIQGHRLRSTGDDDRPAAFCQRHIADQQLGRIAQI